MLDWDTQVPLVPLMGGHRKSHKQPQVRAGSPWRPCEHSKKLPWVSLGSTLAPFVTPGAHQKSTCGIFFSYLHASHLKDENLLLVLTGTLPRTSGGVIVACFSTLFDTIDISG